MRLARWIPRSLGRSFSGHVILYLAFGLALLTLAAPTSAAQGAQGLSQARGSAACPRSTTKALKWLDNFLASQGRLPSYGELIILPTPALGEVLHLLPAKGQADFWQHHLRTFLTTGLSAQERRVLQQVIDKIKPELFDRAAREGTSAVSAELEALQQLLLSTFSRAEVAAMTAPRVGRPLTLEKEAILSLSPQDQFEFWRRHVESFQSDARTPAERHALRQALTLLTPELFARAKDEGGESVRRQLEAIHEVLSKAFSPVEVSAILSPPFGVVSSDSPPPCDCNTGDIENACGGFPNTVICVRGNGRCEPKSFGCGFFLLLDCDGGCCFNTGFRIVCPWSS